MEQPFICSAVLGFSMLGIFLLPGHCYCVVAQLRPVRMLHTGNPKPKVVTVHTLFPILAGWVEPNSAAKQPEDASRQPGARNPKPRKVSGTPRPSDAPGRPAATSGARWFRTDSSDGCCLGVGFFREDILIGFCLTQYDESEHQPIMYGKILSRTGVLEEK